MMIFMQDNTTPYISFIAASRNDDHGGDMLKRMTIFVTALIHQCNKYKLNCELVMVEWNPEPGKPLLSQVLPGAKDADYLAIRYIVVPKEIHDPMAFSAQIPLFQMIAKNVGIRRARGKFVLCTNVDLIFSDELFARLAQKDLREHHFYRANRCDVPASIDETWGVEQQMEFCTNNIKKRLGKNYRYANFRDDTGFLFRYKAAVPILLLLSKIKSLYAKSPDDKITALDCDACGDFTMMSLQNWVDIQGYPELEIYSIHIDSMGIFAAAAAGMTQVVFKPAECTYHMEHAGGWEFKNPIEKIHFFTKKPMLEWWAVREAGLYLIEKGAKFNINKSSWGLADVTLQEIAIG